jgi:hypothetical protein
VRQHLSRKAENGDMCVSSQLHQKCELENLSAGWQTHKTLQLSKITKAKRGRGVTQVVDFLPSKSEAPKPQYLQNEKREGNTAGPGGAHL